MLLGLVFGSFANVLVYRLPRGESIVSPGSRCPSCGHALSWYENIPLASWLVLRGHCRHCDEAISIRYPLLELCLGLTWGYMAWHFGWEMELVTALIFSMMLWVLTWIDLETGLLPDVITLPGIAIGIVFGMVLGHLQDSVIGAVAGYSLFWLVARVFLLLTGREGLGYGDFKLLAMLGAFLGWQALPFVIFISSFCGAVIGSIYLLLTRKHVRAQIPFGPYLAASGMIWLLWGSDLLRWYLDVIKPA
ncbi:MAG: A24 family peptidase [Mariprofundaceae bacterium]|nr:A24 family peptidase [Mariprofundaceae bacterium]